MPKPPYVRRIRKRREVVAAVVVVVVVVEAQTIRRSEKVVPRLWGILSRG